VRPGIVVRAGLTIPEAELEVAFSCSGGPGGQNVNKVATKVELRWCPATSVALTDRDRAWLLERLRNRMTNDGTLIVTSTLTRDQLKNRANAEEKLAQIVRTALDRPTPRKPTRPTRAAKRRRVADKRHRAKVKSERRSSE
jgi:ribosome-associated protein